MKKRLLVTALLFLSSSAQAEINILACEPEWGALAKEIGGDNVKVDNATSALQDPHYIEARPSLIAKARKADMLLCTGADLEVGWLPLLLKKSGNPAIQPGKPGHFIATDHVRLREKLIKVDRSMGHVHAAGNPHIQTDPRKMLKVATALLGRMQEVDPDEARHYQNRYAQFKQGWLEAMKAWKNKAQSLNNTPIVVHHNSWIYMQNWLGLKKIATLEPKPGIPPSAGHLNTVLQALKQTPAEMVIYSAYQNPRSANWLAERAGIPAVKVPSTVGGTAQAKDLFSLFDNIINRLLQAKK